MNNQPAGLTCAGLFAGIGGFCFGFEDAGFSAWASDKDEKVARTYRDNFPDVEFIEADIKDLDLDVLPEVDVLHAGFPCQIWPLEPVTAFYDSLYVNALLQHDNLASAVLDFDAFTDIEFNPKKSINCQAFSAALYCALKWRGLLDNAAQDRERFLQTYKSGEIYAGPSQASLFTPR